MANDVIAELQATARTAPQRVVFPEATEENILRAARQLLDEGMALPVLLGAREELAEAAAGLDLDGFDVVDPTDEVARARLIEECKALFPDMSAKGLERRLRTPLNLGAFLVAADLADALVAGIKHTTQDVILAAMTFIGMQPGISIPSSLMLMRVPGYEGPEGNLIVFADCGVAVAPDAAELAEIALTTAQSVRMLLGWEPRVALLSFSTKGSGDHESVVRVVEATRIAREREPGLLIDGELQLDAAIVPSVAARKVPGESPAAGRANILIFPELNAGNIACKAVQRFAKADAFGPFLQGFAKTVCDLSRGATVTDVVGAAVMACVHAQGGKHTAAEGTRRSSDGERRPAQGGRS
jgi:phosphate acetyltransferase